METLHAALSRVCGTEGLADRTTKWNVTFARLGYTLARLPVMQYKGHRCFAMEFPHLTSENAFQLWPPPKGRQRKRRASASRPLRGRGRGRGRRIRSKRPAAAISDVVDEPELGGSDLDDDSSAESGGESGSAELDVVSDSSKGCPSDHGQQTHDNQLDGDASGTDDYKPDCPMGHGWGSPDSEDGHVEGNSFADDYEDYLFGSGDEFEYLKA